MYNAMKSGDREDTNTLRTTLSKLKDKVIEKRQDLSKEEEVKILQTLVKQRKESIELYEKGGRNELALQPVSDWRIMDMGKSMSFPRK